MLDGVYVQQHRDVATSSISPKQLENGLGEPRIERGRRLVRKNCPRFLRERARDGHALLLTTGQLACETLRLLGQPDLRQRSSCDVAIRRAEHAQQSAPPRDVRDPREQHVLLRGEGPHEIELLKHESDRRPCARERAATRERDLVATDADAAARGFDQSASATQQRAFPRARSSENRDDFAGRDAQRDTVDRARAVGPLLAELIDGNPGVHE